MGQSLYENAKDLEKEAKMMKVVKSIFRLDSHKLPISWEYDALLSYKGICVGMAEYKNRTHDFSKYPTVVIGRSKVLKGLNFCKLHFRADMRGPLTFHFFVNFTDGFYFTRLFEGEEKELSFRKLTARNHADDPTDTEYIFDIPNSRFFKLCASVC